MTPEQMRRAAEILREAALITKAKYTTMEGVWMSAPANIRHDEMVGLAIALDLLADHISGAAAGLDAAWAMKEPKAP